MVGVRHDFGMSMHVHIQCINACTIYAYMHVYKITTYSVPVHVQVHVHILGLRFHKGEVHVRITMSPWNLEINL